MIANKDKMNIGFFYNRLYFESANEGVISDNNKELLNVKYHPDREKYLCFPNEANSFTLTTTYPGLFTGAGLSHEQGITGELKLGFYFDYTTGMPVIPGSTVKGMLRNAFPQWDNHPDPKENIKRAKTAYILAALKREKDESFNDFKKRLQSKSSLTKEELDRVKKIEREIFDGIVNDEHLSIYSRDLFWDAYIVKGGKDGLIFGDDAITPHVRDGVPYQKSMLLDPIPITFLKILPNVSFKFNFVLKDHKDMDSKLLNVEEKTLLFKTILEDFGIGAKTNVGYGQLIEANNKK